MRLPPTARCAPRIGTRVRKNESMGGDGIGGHYLVAGHFSRLYPDVLVCRTSSDQAAYKVSARPVTDAARPGGPWKGVPSPIAHHRSPWKPGVGESHGFTNPARARGGAQPCANIGQHGEAPSRVFRLPDNWPGCWFAHARVFFSA